MPALCLAYSRCVVDPIPWKTDSKILPLTYPALSWVERGADLEQRAQPIQGRLQRQWDPYSDHPSPLYPLTLEQWCLRTSLLQQDLFASLLHCWNVHWDTFHKPHGWFAERQTHGSISSKSEKDSNFMKILMTLILVYDILRSSRAQRICPSLPPTVMARE